MENLEKLLLEYTEDEVFYKAYYEAKKDKYKLEEFLKNADRDFIKLKNILIPEIRGDIYFHNDNQLTEEDAFSVKDIFISKHYRYTPEFTHSHIFFEVMYVLSGTCLQQINGEQVNLKSGDVCIVAPGVSHSLGVFDDSVIINILIKRSTFDSTFFELLKSDNVLSIFFTKILNNKSHNNYIVFNTNEDIDIKDMVIKLYKEYLDDEKYNEIIINNMIMMFFGILLRRYEEKVKLHNENNGDVERIVDILKYIQNNYETVTLKELSENFHFTTPYISKLIKEHTGKTFTTIVSNLKMEQACKFLIGTNFTIEKISNIIGYENKEHFIRRFKKKIGVPPSQYRRNREV